MIGLGSNRAGAWGTPAQTLTRACEELRRAGLELLGKSDIYASAPMGTGRLDAYANAVIAVASHRPPAALLRLLKRIERRAGRRSAMPWGPRSLDLDIIDYKGLVRNWRGATPKGRGGARRRLVLPHPAAHERPFVMVPLAAAFPAWRHPVTGRSAGALARALGSRRGGRILGHLEGLG